jgi:putative oxidoreductase
MAIDILIRKHMKASSNKTFDITVLIVRVFLGIVIGAHGAQKLLGWFDGFGFASSMDFFTETIGLPGVLGFLIILAESLGMVALIVGLFSRVMAAGLIVIMTGAIITVQAQFGFFMNWFGNKGGEGIEFSLLTIAMAIVVVLNGSGIYSFDHLLFRRIAVNTAQKINY